MMNATQPIARIRKSLATQLCEAAAAQGTTLTPVVSNETGGRLMYRVGDNPAIYTPGEVAVALGVVLGR